MSTTRWLNPNNNTYYDIGVWKWVGSTNKEGEKTDVSTFNLLVPTYGTWAGPEWASGDRAPRNSDINWDIDPKSEGVKSPLGSSRRQYT